MDETQAASIWSVFEEVAPNLCYISRTRDKLASLLSMTDDPERLMESLAYAASEAENASFRTDLRILHERLARTAKKPLRG